MVAAAQGHASVVERLINAGGNPNPQTKVQSRPTHAILKNLWIVFNYIVRMDGALSILHAGENTQRWSRCFYAWELILTSILM